MEGNMWIFATLGLIIFWMMPVDSMAIRFNFTLREAKISLSMVKDSVDDMYFDCNDQMMTIVKDKYLQKEKKRFKKHWNAAQSCAKRGFDEREDKDKALTIDHTSAICVYTANTLYKEFNTAVRTKGSSYTKSFKYHSLHYLLTSAIQILNNNSCHSTFRRTKDIFTGELNKIIRFGSFTSTSIKSNLTNFGSKTCFKIKTCYGAYLNNYPVNGVREAEVLIPPYETFNITEKSRFQIQGLEDCEVVFVLVSAGVKSSLNCKVVPVK
ncbi:ecto-ADP-ribosyltransferase 4-like isoform X1 [Trematomus bernacchii]|uniref:ecto-ADP-ribosyltransferase 4-like isoform X1 n=1 Tax=Trematomus bernacchii TaxID=40690 RepID=UPI00146A0F6E|nr:ecto-ADP-ribosyltransferase 4-like isoform X1 [Trematomus bernacchii]